MKRVRTNTQVSDMRVLHIDAFARLSAKAAHEMQTFLRELRKLKKSANEQLTQTCPKRCLTVFLLWSKIEEDKNQ